MSTRTRPLFRLGQIVASPGALEALAAARFSAGELLARHAAGEWGNVSAEDARENDFLVRHGLRILSSYQLPTGAKLWIITESDRSATTLLLPAEY